MPNAMALPGQTAARIQVQPWANWRAVSLSIFLPTKFWLHRAPRVDAMRPAYGPPRISTNWLGCTRFAQRGSTGPLFTLLGASRYRRAPWGQSLFSGTPSYQHWGSTGLKGLAGRGVRPPLHRGLGGVW